MRNNKAKKEREARERKLRILAAERKTERLLRYLFSLLAKMAKADGRVVEKEVKIAEKVFDRFDFAARHRAFCVKVFNSAKDNNRDILWYARMFRSLADDNQCMFAYELLWDVACADGVLHPRQKEILLGTCQLLLHTESYFSINYRRRKSSFKERVGYEKAPPPPPKDKTQGAKRRPYKSGVSPIAEAYAILGCKPDASNEELKAAHRAAVRMCHPDKFRQADSSEEKLRRATEMMAEINTAWDDIRNARGIKR